MNTDKTIRDKFVSHKEYPIWYYKELKEVDAYYVIFNLLKETFVVELENKRIEMTFGKNRKHEIGCTQSCSDGLDYTSYETVNRAFKNGKWFIITKDNTNEDFKNEYIKDKEIKDRANLRQINIDILRNGILSIKDIDNCRKNELIKDLNNKTDVELEEYISIVCSKIK